MSPWAPRAGLAAISLLAAALSLLATRNARADEGEWLVGAEAVGELPAAAGLGAVAQLGLGDVLALRAGAGARHDGDRLDLDARAALVWAWDVLVWVPEVLVGAGVRSGPSAAGEIFLGLDVRRYISLDWSVTFGLAGGYRTDGQRYGTLGVAVWRRLR